MLRVYPFYGVLQMVKSTPICFKKNIRKTLSVKDFLLIIARYTFKSACEPATVLILKTTKTSYLYEVLFYVYLNENLD